jgi:hypothetical protein
MTQDNIHLEQDGPGSFTFSFSSPRGELSGVSMSEPKGLRTSDRMTIESKRPKIRFWRSRENSARPAGTP